MEKMRIVILILCLLITIGFETRSQNIILNPSFESGTAATSENQVPYATGWSVGCAVSYAWGAPPPTYGYPGTPDLFDVTALCQNQVKIPLNKWSTLSERTNHNRYVGLTGGQYQTINGTLLNFANESVRGTITEPLISGCSYTISLYTAAIQGYHVNCPPYPYTPQILPPGANYNCIEVLLRKDDNCSDSYTILITPNITLTSWTQFSGSFICPSVVAAWNPNKIEFRMSSYPENYYPPITSTHAVFLDDVSLTRGNVLISSDFSLSGDWIQGSPTYIVTATVQSIPVGSSFWWEVSEINKETGVVVPYTTLTNPPSWWITQLRTINTFPGYCCQTNVTTGNGVFYYGHKYRITRGTWGPCTNWTSTSNVIYIGKPDDDQSGEPVYLIEKDTNYQVDKTIVQGLLATDEPNTKEQSYNPIHGLNESSNIILQPNPCLDFLEINFLAGHSDYFLFVKVFDINGIEKRVSLKIIDSKKAQINLQSIPPGLYILKIFDGKSQLTKKFVKVSE